MSRLPTSCGRLIWTATQPPGSLRVHLGLLIDQLGQLEPGSVRLTAARLGGTVPMVAARQHLNRLEAAATTGETVRRLTDPPDAT